LNNYKRLWKEKNGTIERASKNYINTDNVLHSYARYN